MKCAFYTLGCKVNQYESQAMAESLGKYGFTCVDPGEEADVYIVNSCTVTAESDRKTRQAVRRFKKAHPASIVVLTGCMPQASPDAAGLIEQADIVMGNRNSENLFALIMQFINTRQRVFAVEPHEQGEKISGSTIGEFYEKTRAIVKIQDGCNSFCTYCIIPYARGRNRSKPLGVIREEVSALANKGFKEIVLVGINLSAYGRDTADGADLAAAVREAASVPGILRVRLGSLEPNFFTWEIIDELSRIPQFCPQFHISLQSGCDKTLKNMNRHYTTVEYEDLCAKLREVFPDAAITTDVMVGFPGESLSDFKISLDFVKKIGFEKVHVFPYSRRPGTRAANMPDQITATEKSRRADEMIDEAEKIRNAYFRSQVGRVLEILPEEHYGGEIRGYTANYIPVKARGVCGGDATVRVKITGVADDFCVGDII